MYVREPAVAGRFYTADPAALRQEIEAYIDAVELSKTEADSLIGVVSPHAGYIYSGSVAAYAYKEFEKTSFDAVLILAPSHRYRFDLASVIPSGLYKTPLGDQVIDEGIGEELLSSTKLVFLKDAHELEHSLEVQVPFLQIVQPNATLVPVLIGTDKLASLKETAEALYRAIEQSGKRVALVISTDLSHFLSYERAVATDRKFIDVFESFDYMKLADSIKSGDSAACGSSALITGFMLAQMLGAKKSRVLKYLNSGDTAGPKDEVVGYLAARMER